MTIPFVSPDYSVDGGILAGGRGQRMGGLDKGLVAFDGKPMIQYVYAALTPHVRTVWINCNRNQDRYRSISPHLCSDSSQEFPGPLAGLASLLASSNADFILTSPCDTPFIRNDYGSRMLSALAECVSDSSQTDMPLVLAARSGTQVHPLHLCLSRQSLLAISSCLQNTELRVMAWLASMNPRYVCFDDDALQFRNLNRPDDLASSV